MDTLATNKPKLDLLRRWRTNCRRSQIANYAAAARYSKRNYLIGIPTVILSAIVGTSVFAALGKADIHPYLQITVGLISVLSATLAALQTFLKWGEAAAKYASTASVYGSVKRQLDHEIVKLECNEAVSEEVVAGIREQMDTLSREAPVVPGDIWERARGEAVAVDAEHG